MTMRLRVSLVALLAAGLSLMAAQRASAQGRPVRWALVAGFVAFLVILGLAFNRYRLGQRATRRREALELERKVKAQLREVDLMKDQVLANASHEEEPPRAASPEPPAVETVTSQADKTDKTAQILVVDDEPVNRLILREQLAVGGYAVREAVDGFQALASLEGVDLVLLDVMMPRMSGYEVCRTLRERFSRRELPVIFVTARSLPEDMEEGLASGGNDYLTKPVAMQELLARVGSQLALCAGRGSSGEKLLEGL